jgi:hypothetical protein
MIIDVGNNMNAAVPTAPNMSANVRPSNLLLRRITVKKEIMKTIIAHSLIDGMTKVPKTALKSLQRI